MLFKILAIYLIGILISQPVYIGVLYWLWKKDDEEEERYAMDYGDVDYESGKPNIIGVLFLLVIGGILWPIGVLLAIFLFLTFWVWDKVPILGPQLDGWDKDEDEYH
jgi:hypothetical protein